MSSFFGFLRYKRQTASAYQAPSCQNAYAPHFASGPRRLRRQRGRRGALPPLRPGERKQQERGERAAKGPRVRLAPCLFLPLTDRSCSFFLCCCASQRSEALKLTDSLLALQVRASGSSAARRCRGEPAQAAPCAAGPPAQVREQAVLARCAEQRVLRDCCT